MKGWKRILVAKSISGMLTLPRSNMEARVVPLTDGAEALEVRVIYGTTVIVR